MENQSMSEVTHSLLRLHVVVMAPKYRPSQGSFFRLHVARKHPNFFPCYKRYKNSRIFLDEKAKCQPWIIIKKPKFG
jgi:hypothetical protein